MLGALEGAGFEDMSVWHWLGVRVDRVMEEFEGKELEALTT